MAEGTPRRWGWGARTLPSAVLASVGACAVGAVPTSEAAAPVEDVADAASLRPDARGVAGAVPGPGPGEAGLGAHGEDAGAPTQPDASGGLDATIEAAAPSGLDPDVLTPDPSAPSCAPPGDLLACPGIQACRIASPSGGRCEDCAGVGRCSGLSGSTCSTSVECARSLQCFRGRCARFCALFSVAGCPAARPCLSVGHPSVGLCDPGP